MNQSVKIRADRGTKRVVAAGPSSSLSVNPHQARIRTPSLHVGVSNTQRDAKVKVTVTHGLIELGVASATNPAAINDRADYVCGENLMAPRIVKEDADGKIYYASHTDVAAMDATLGLTLQAGILGAAVGVLFYGEYKFNGWNWIPKKPIFLGTNGQITQTPPTTGFLLRLGFASESDEIVLRIDRPILRA